MRKVILTVSCLCLGAAAYGEQWQILGTRATGMGGAFVGMAKGPVAQYWNPAGLYQEDNVSGLDIPVGANVEFTGNIMENASEIGKLAEKYEAIQNAQTSGGAIDADEMAAFVKTLVLLEDMNETGKGALVEVGGGINLKFSKIAVSINNFTSLGATPFIDTENVGLNNTGSQTGVDMSGSDITQDYMDTTQKAAANTIKLAVDAIGFTNVENLLCGSSGCLDTQVTGLTGSQELANALVNQVLTMPADQLTEAANTMLEHANDAQPIITNLANGKDYTDNTSHLTLSGASFTEIAFGTARPFFLDGLTIGGNLKLVNGRVAYTSFTFLSEQAGQTGAFDDALDETEDNWKPALDLGFMWEMNKVVNLPMNPRAGLVIRNLNAPKFDRPALAGGGDYQLDRQIRLGFAVSPADFWHLALDMDITKNDTPVEGFESRQLALGTEINIFNRPSINIPLRAGIMKNLAESDSKATYTLGLGINLVHLHVDLAGIMSSDSTTIEGDDVPRKFGGSASIGLLF